MKFIILNLILLVIYVMPYNCNNRRLNNNMNNTAVNNTNTSNRTNNNTRLNNLTIDIKPINFPENCNKEEKYSNYNEIILTKYEQINKLSKLITELNDNIDTTYSFIPPGSKYLEDIKKFIISEDFNTKIHNLNSVNNTIKCDIFEKVNILTHLPLSFDYKFEYFLNFFNFTNYNLINHNINHYLFVLKKEDFNSDLYKITSIKLNKLNNLNNELNQNKNEFVKSLVDIIKNIIDLDYKNSEVNDKIENINNIIGIKNKTNENYLKECSYNFDIINKNKNILKIKLESLQKNIINISKINEKMIKIKDNFIDIIYNKFTSNNKLLIYVIILLLLIAN